MYTTKFIGKGSGFSQRHFDKHYNQFCPQSAYSRTKGLTRSPVTLSAIREDILRNQTSKFRPTDPMFDDVVRDATLAWRLPEQVNPIHLNDLPKSTYDTDSSLDYLGAYLVLRTREQSWIMNKHLDQYVNSGTSLNIQIAKSIHQIVPPTSDPIWLKKET